MRSVTPDEDQAEREVAGRLQLIETLTWRGSEALVAALTSAGDLGPHLGLVDRGGFRIEALPVDVEERDAKLAELLINNRAEMHCQVSVEEANDSDSRFLLYTSADIRGGNRFAFAMAGQAANGRLFVTQPSLQEPQGSHTEALDRKIYAYIDFLDLPSGKPAEAAEEVLAFTDELRDELGRVADLDPDRWPFKP